MSLNFRRKNEEKLAKEKLEAAKEFAKELEEKQVTVSIKQVQAEEVSALSQQKRLRQQQKPAWL